MNGFIKVLYTINGISLNIKTEENCAILDNIDEPCVHYDKWNKSLTETQKPYDSTNIKQRAEWWFPGVGGEEEMGSHSSLMGISFSWEISISCRDLL